MITKTITVKKKYLANFGIQDTKDNWYNYFDEKGSDELTRQIRGKLEDLLIGSEIELFIDESTGKYAGFEVTKQPNPETTYNLNSDPETPKRIARSVAIEHAVKYYEGSRVEKDTFFQKAKEFAHFILTGEITE